jgi:hypothetical protein
MGLFDKKDKKGGRKDDFDSPMESIDLDRETQPAPAAAASAAAAPAAPAATATAAPAVNAPAAAGGNPGPRSAPPRPAPAPPPALSSPDSDNYGIDKAIELMRTLPTENIQLVVQVVKFSLESVGIKLPVIIEDAIRRQKDLRGRVDVLKSEISELEQEIQQRRVEIDRHEADFRETTTVRERLEMAEGQNRGKSDGEGAAAHGPTPGSPTLPRASRTTGAPPVIAAPTPAPAPASTPAPLPGVSPSGASAAQPQKK